MTSSTPNPKNRLADQALALAGLVQAAHLVHQLAQTGQTTQPAFQCLAESLFVTDPDKTLAVYQPLQGLESGLRLLNDMLGGRYRSERNAVMQYAVSILHLAKKLAKNPRMLNSIAEGLVRIESQAKHFACEGDKGYGHDTVISALADLYTQTLSTLGPRIQVRGHYSHLQQPRIANQIRTLLFAAIRAAILWRQTGGNLFTLIIQKGPLQTATAHWLNQITAATGAAPDHKP
jgi:high frequency lysogenization protein